MKKIIVYDLNRTLYRKSSKNEFFKFICKKKPFHTIHVFRMLGIAILKGVGLADNTLFKQHFYSYLNNIPPSRLEKYAREFWEREFPMKFRRKMLADIEKYTFENIEIYIITGAFEIYTKYLEKKLPVKLLGTRSKYSEGKYIIQGKACNNEEKIRRLKEDVKDEYILLKAYSDDDEEILYHAQDGYFLDKKGKLKKVEK